MSFPDWREPVRLLEAATSAVATEEQRGLAAKIGLPLNGSRPRIVVAAMLEDPPVIRGLETGARKHAPASPADEPWRR